MSGKVPYYTRGKRKDTIEISVSKAILDKKLPTLSVDLQLTPSIQFLFEKVCKRCWEHDSAKRLEVSEAIHILNEGPQPL